MCLCYIRMNHGCPFEYFIENGFFGIDIMDIAWILQSGYLQKIVGSLNLTLEKR